MTIKRNHIIFKKDKKMNEYSEEDNTLPLACHREVKVENKVKNLS